MTVLSVLTMNGLQAKVQGTLLLVFPRERLNDELRTYIREHKLAIVCELKKNTINPQNHVHRFRIDGKVVTTYTDEPSSEAFLKSLLRRFGIDRRITLLETWPIAN